MIVWEKKINKAKIKLLSSEWILISVASAQSQSNAMAFPHTPHLLHPDICSTKSSFLRQISAELKTSKAFFFPLP